MKTKELTKTEKIEIFNLIYEKLGEFCTLETTRAKKYRLKLKKIASKLIKE